MSRAEYSNDHYEFAFGVDHATGPFLQVWDKTLEQLEPVVNVDWFSVRTHNLTPNTPLSRRVDTLFKAFEQAKKMGINAPNMAEEHVWHIAEVLGFPPSIRRKIWELWD
jgi:hypothetical protein